MLTAAGGIYSKGEDWRQYAMEDGLFVIGQNPASSERIVEILLAKIGH